jgi:uncharacterized protein
LNGEKRRQEIISKLRTCAEPISGTALAAFFHISRQIIVQDIALLKASNHNIIATSKGYILIETPASIRIFKVHHNTEQIEDELYTIVDNGGRVIDVFVRHSIYGEIRAALSLVSRREVDDFVRRLFEGEISPLKQLTNDYHFHTVAADNEAILDVVEQKLREKHYLA